MSNDLPLWAVILAATLSSSVAVSIIGFIGIVFQARTGKPKLNVETRSVEIAAQGGALERLTNEAKRAYDRADDAEAEAEAAQKEADEARMQAKRARVETAKVRRDLDRLTSEFHQFRELVEQYLRDHSVPVPEWVRKLPHDREEAPPMNPPESP